MEKKSFTTDSLRLGVCYYPEHWDEALWAADFQRMRDLGLSIIRVGEFAWSIFEPAEGRFCFDLFDRALDLAHQFGLAVILGTPTATPPAWLTHKYPEVLNVSQAGVQYQHGQRRHYGYNAPIYQQLSCRIVNQLAEHFRDHPAIIGWQIDNEINCEANVFYAEADHAAFRAWLRCRYGSLDVLNAAWGAVFWSQTYSEWEQVHLTRPSVSNSPNPHQALDEKRFFSACAIAFVHMQAEIIRRLAPHHWITTNGIFGHLDNHRMTQEALDFISYDSYPNFSTTRSEEETGGLGDRAWGWNLSVARDISPRFCVMEQQTGPGGWVNRMAAPSPLPGQLRLWTYQSVAHGADAVLYFRWRTATFGTEIYWFGIHDYDLQPNRRVAEVQRVGAEFARIGALVAGSTFQASVALVKDYDNEWDGEFDAWYGPLVRRSTMAWYRTLQCRHIPVDVLSLVETTTLDDLRKYSVLIYPHPAIMTNQTGSLLGAYVRQGGKVIFGCRTGYKDGAGHRPMRPMPGPVADLCGVRVEDFTLIGPHAAPPRIAWSEGIQAPATTADGFNDVLAAGSPEAVVLARYDEGYYAGAPALVRTPHGAGAAYYYGAAFNQQVTETLSDLCGLHSPADGLLALPAAVELCIRTQDGGDDLWFLLNFASTSRQITVYGRRQDLLTGAAVSGTVEMEPFAVLILTMPGAKE